MSSCINCKRKITFFNETFPLWPGTDDCLCASCFDKMSGHIGSHNVSGERYKECENQLRELGFTEAGLEYIAQYCRYHDGLKIDVEQERAQNEQEQERKKQELEQRNERIARSKNIIVTTADLREDYDVLGPVYFQVSNKGFFSSALEKLVEKYQKQIDAMRDEGTMAEDNGASLSDILFMPLFDLALRENKFETAFYVATEELKKRAAIIGADAIVGMRQDIDMDTNGFQYFYLQMYGTAVRFKRSEPGEKPMISAADDAPGDTRMRRRASRAQE